MPRPEEDNSSLSTESEAQKDQRPSTITADLMLPSWLIESLAVWGCENPWWRDMTHIRRSSDFPAQPIRLDGWFESEEDGSYHAIVRRGNSPRTVMTEAEWNRLKPWEGKTP